MTSIDWIALVSTCASINAAANLLHESIFEMYNYCFPERTIRLRSTDPRWMKPSLKRLMDDRHRAFHKRQFDKYNRLKEEVSSLCRYLRDTYLKDAVESGNARKLWTSLKSISRYSKQESCDGVSAEEFSDYFSSVFGVSPPINPVYESVDCESILLFLSEVTAELSRISKSTTGPDGIPAWILRDFSEYLAPVLTMIFNWSLRIGVVPDAFKKASVRPVAK